MAEAYIFCPDVITDAFDKNSKNHLFTIALISLLWDEKQKYSPSSKRFTGFVSDYHKSKMIDIALEMLNDEKIGEEELYTLNIILSSLEEEGINYEEYKDEYTPIFDLCEQIKDSYDNIIVCNNGHADKIQKELGFKYNILSSDQAFLKIFDRSKFE